jgi:glycosyltransferase involved in cell wall biosynthesis
LVDRYPKLGVLIMGTGPGTPNLVARAESLGVSDHCIFTGQVPFAVVPRYVNALDVGVSLLGPKHQTSSELKVRQYLACGKPIVAATPGSNDFLEDHGFGSLVPHDDLDRIAEHIIRWLSLSKTERAAFAARAARYAASHLAADATMARRLTLWEISLH